MTSFSCESAKSCACQRIMEPRIIPVIMIHCQKVGIFAKGKEEEGAERRSRGGIGGISIDIYLPMLYMHARTGTHMHTHAHARTHTHTEPETMALSLMFLDPFVRISATALIQGLLHGPASAHTIPRSGTLGTGNGIVQSTTYTAVTTAWLTFFVLSPVIPF